MEENGHVHAFKEFYVLFVLVCRHVHVYAHSFIHTFIYSFIRSYIQQMFVEYSITCQELC